MGCNMKFKTKKQKLIHHNKMEPECKHERISLVKLIKRFKTFVEHIDNSGKVENMKSLDSYINLQKTYEDTEKKLLDPDYFHCILGKNFEDKCPESEDEQNKE